MPSWSETSWQDQAWGESWGGERESESFGFSRALDATADGPKVITNKEGDPLTYREAQAELAELDELRLDIDLDVKDIADPQDQAWEAWLLNAEYDERAKLLKEYIRHLGKSEFFMEDQAGNEAVAEMVGGVVQRYEDRLQALKDQAGQEIRDGTDALREQGMEVNVETRDRVYERLTDAEVIESWEPLEL